MKIAFVVQRYGHEVNGGAELLCRWLAERLALNHDITVITTCAKEYVTWKNEYAEGATQIGNVSVLRFPVDACRNNEDFAEFSRWMFSHPHSPEDEIEWMRLQGPYSTPLLEFLSESKDNFDLFIFFTYLYATTYFGISRVSGKAWLVPAAHDERPIRLPLFKQVFEAADLLIFSTAEEQQFVERLFPRLRCPWDIIGVGINVPDDISPQRFLSKFEKKELASQRLLYVGRIDPAKGCAELFEYTQRFVENYAGSVSLLVAGQAVMPIPKSSAIVPLGFISETEKFDAIAASTLLINPSRFESLSMVLLEAWMLERPVVVNGRCRVLEGQCRRSNGGLWYRDYAEFYEILSCLLKSPKLRDFLGRGGKRFVQDSYSWDVVLGKYERLFTSYVSDSRDSKPAQFESSHLPTQALAGHVYVMLANCVSKDAVSNDALLQYRLLRETGYRCSIYAAYSASDVDGFVRSIDTFPSASECSVNDTLIYHYSMGWEKGEAVFTNFPGRRIFKYHNVTPPVFFRPYNSEYDLICSEGRKDLERFARLPNVWVMADSVFNASELLANGAALERTVVVPPIHQIEKLLQTPPSLRALSEFGNGTTNVLFVGRVVPNKGHRDLIRAFAHYHAQNSQSQLIIAGNLDPRLKKYYAELDLLVLNLKLRDCVRFLGSVNAAELRALYETADVFVCTSQHEGFCVPIIEAMAFGVPVVACGNTAVRENLENTGIWWPSADPESIAESIHVCVSNCVVTQALQRSARREYEARYSPLAVRKRFLSELAKIVKCN